MTSTSFWIVLLFWSFGIFFLWRIPSVKKRTGAEPFSLRVSIIIPARNEEKKLGPLLHSLSQQTPNPHEVIVVDDHSEDATAEIAQKGGAVVLSSRAVPEGWTGKPWACWQGAHDATGDVFLFLDADTRLEQDGLSKILSTYLEKRGLLSVQPYHRMERSYERLSAFFNIIAMAGMNAFTPLGSRLKPTGAFGPCLVCSREDYDEVGGHEKVRGEVLESLGLAREFLKANKDVYAYGGRGAISFRMYPEGLRALVEGHSKGFGTGARFISFFSLLLIVCWVVGGFSLTRHLGESFLLGDPMTLLTWAGLEVLYLFQIHWMLRRIGNFGFLTAFLFQIPLIFFALVFGLSLLRVFLMRKVRWKGRMVRVRTRIG